MTVTTISTPAATITTWADKIRPHITGAVEHIIAAGRELLAAKGSLPHGQFGPLLAELDITARTAQRFMEIARHPVISNPTHASHLPTAWTVLFELTKVPADVLEDAISTGVVSPATTRGEAEKVAATGTESDPVAAQFVDLFGDVFPGLAGEDLMFIFETNVAIKVAARRLVQAGEHSEPPASFDVDRYLNLFGEGRSSRAVGLERPTRPSQRYATFELLVEREAGEFLAWCQAAGVVFEGRKVILPEVWMLPDDDDVPGEWGDDDRQLAAMGRFWCWWGIDEMRDQQ